MENTPQEKNRMTDRKNPKKLPRPRRNRSQKNQFRNDDDFNWGKVLKVVLSWSAIILLVFIVMTLFRTQEGTELEVQYTQYQDFLSKGQIYTAVIKKSDLNNYDFHGVLKSPAEVQTSAGKTATIERFTVTLPYLDGTVIKDWNDKGIRFTITKDDNLWMNSLVSILPWIGLVVVWLFIMRRMQGMGTKGIFSFGKSRVKTMNEGTVKVTFQDVAGADEAKVELQEIIEFLKEPSKFQRLGGKIPRGGYCLVLPEQERHCSHEPLPGKLAFRSSQFPVQSSWKCLSVSVQARVRDLFETGKEKCTRDYFHR